MRRPAAILYLMSLSATAGDVYRSVDSQGHVLYSDTPGPGAELVHVQSLREAPAAQAGTAPADQPKRDDSSRPGPKPASANPGTADAQRAVQSDLQQTRADQCKQAQDSYQQAIQARRVYKAGADGEREYLSDEEADQVRLNARLEMEAACKSS